MVDLATATSEEVHELERDVAVDNQSTYVLMLQWCLVATNRAKFFFTQSSAIKKFKPSNTMLVNTKNSTRKCYVNHNTSCMGGCQN